MGKLFQQLRRQGVRVVSSEDHYLADFTLVVDETHVFVIEVKSVSMHYNIFDSQSAEAFRAYIDEHYLVGAGTPQLERYIRYINGDSQKLLSIQNPAKKLNIYPIIVVTDAKTATYGVNDYVGQKANEGFFKFKSDFNKIMPLTMIQSVFFLENISLLSKEKAMLKKLIREYHFYVKRNRNCYQKDSSMENYLKAMVSFDQFAIGKYGAFTLPQEQIYYHFESVFGLTDRS